MTIVHMGSAQRALSGYLESRSRTSVLCVMVAIRGRSWVCRWSVSRDASSCGERCSMSVGADPGSRESDGTFALMSCRLWRARSREETVGGKGVEVMVRLE